MATLKISAIHVIANPVLIFQVGSYVYFDASMPKVVDIHLQDDNVFSVECDDGTVREIINCPVIIVNSPKANV